MEADIQAEEIAAGRRAAARAVEIQAEDHREAGNEEATQVADRMEALRLLAVANRRRDATTANVLHAVSQHAPLTVRRLRGSLLPPMRNDNGECCGRIRKTRMA